jgi:hypothetical protein
LIIYSLKEWIYKSYNVIFIYNMPISKRYFLLLSLSYFSFLAFNQSGITLSYEKNIIYKKKLKILVNILRI